MAAAPRAGSPALAIGEGLARLIAFGTTVYLARMLGPDLYGVVAVAAGVMLYLTQIADSGVELAGMTDASAGPERASAVVTGAITQRLLAVVWPMGFYSLSLPVTALSVRWVYLGLQQATPVAVSRIVSDVGTGVLTFALVRAMLSRGRRLVLFTLLGLVLYNIDLLILRYLRGEADAGRYAAAYVIISFCAILMIACSHTVLPSMARDETPTAGTAATYASALLPVNGIASVNVGLNLALIPGYGLVDAAWATALSEVVRLVVTALAARDAVPGALSFGGPGRVRIAAR